MKGKEFFIAAGGAALFIATQRNPRARARRLIMEFEGLSLERYTDVSGYPHIGYGHRIRDDEDLDVITMQEAEMLLNKDLRAAQLCLNMHLTQPITVNQRAALLSFVYNVGCGAFARSTLLQLLNTGDYTGAADELLKWNKAGGEVRQGLVDRRFLEREEFLA